MAGQHSLPIFRSLRLVLSNGASITVPSALRREQPYFLKFDVFNHNLWRHNIKGEVDAGQADQATPDRTLGFYNKYKQRSSGQQQRQRR
ncbi:hypothetical protein PLESTM_000772000 [Pleodorina starrii]|nr:hypothetical protein PLESTM_000772000 [Pleodorina starrii]